MITIICATHRPQNQTLRVVKKYKEILKTLGEEVSILEMSELPTDFALVHQFNHQSDAFKNIIKEKIEAAKKLVIIAPEYNGSYPGIFKMFLETAPRFVWKGKKAALVGVASGRAGNLRGMDHLTDVLHYMRVEVFSLKIPMSSIDGLLDAQGDLIDTESLEVLQEQAKAFLLF